MRGKHGTQPYREREAESLAVYLLRLSFDTQHGTALSCTGAPPSVFDSLFLLDALWLCSVPAERAR